MARHHLIPGAITLGICLVLSILVSEGLCFFPIPPTCLEFHQN
jgi:hypothetical protein